MVINDREVQEIIIKDIDDKVLAVVSDEEIIEEDDISVVIIWN